MTPEPAKPSPIQPSLQSSAGTDSAFQNRSVLLPPARVKPYVTPFLGALKILGLAIPIFATGGLFATFGPLLSNILILAGAGATSATGKPIQLAHCNSTGPLISSGEVLSRGGCSCPASNHDHHHPTGMC